MKRKSLETFAFELHMVVLLSVFKYNLKNYKNIVLVFSLFVPFRQFTFTKKKKKEKLVFK